MAKPIDTLNLKTSEVEFTVDQIRRLEANLVSSPLLDLINAVLEAGPEAASIVLERVDNPATRRGLENLARFLGIAGRLDPLILKGLQEGLAQAARAERAKESPRLLSIVKSLADPSFRRGLAVGIALIRGLGSVGQ